jgi:hypothetical protein
MVGHFAKMGAWLTNFSTGDRCCQILRKQLTKFDIFPEAAVGLDAATGPTTFLSFGKVG